MNKEAGEGRQRNRNKLIVAYEAYKRKEPGSSDNLMLTVRNFAYTKVYHLEFEFKDLGTSETADDWAQEVVLRVWQGLNKFHGTSEMFYSWVHKIAFNQATDAFNNLRSTKDSKVLLFEKEEDENGEIKEEENPEIHNQAGVEFSITIPKSVQGIDLNICKLIMDGMSYAEVADALKMTENAVEHRLRKLRKRLASEKAKRS